MAKLPLASILAYYSYVGVRQYSTSVVSTNFTFSTFGSSVLRGSAFGWLGLVGDHSRLGFSLGDMEKFLPPLNCPEATRVCRVSENV